MWKAILILCSFSMTFAIASGNEDDNTTLPEANRTISVNCSDQYSMSCFKTDVGKLVDKLSDKRSFQILPWIAIVRDEKNDSESSFSKREEGARSANSSDVNAAAGNVVKKVARYLSSLSVRVSLLNNPLMKAFKAAAYGMLTDMISTDSTGRKKTDMKYAWSAATLAALGFAGLAAMAGKAMLTASIALVLSILCLLKGCGHGGKSSHYEIITKPASVHDVEHIGVHAGPVATAPYSSYARHLIEDNLIPALSILDGEGSEEKEIQAKFVPVHHGHHAAAYHAGQNQQQAFVTGGGRDVIYG